MEDFVAYTSRWRMALLVTGSIGFVAIGIWMTGLMGTVPVSTRAGPLMTEFWGWLGILFFGLCALKGASLWWGNSERLRIGRAGIRWLAWCDQTIPWSEIINVTEWRYKSSTFIILHLRNPSLFPGKGFSAFMQRVNRKLTGGDVSISLTGTDRKLAEARAAIAQFRR